MKTIFSAKEIPRTIKIGKEPEGQTPADSPSGFGQLPIDVLENNNQILIAAPLAGVDLEQAEVIINKEVLTIRGKREMDSEDYGFGRKDYYVQECFWGEFSRSIILPANADTNAIEAIQKNHILYIKIPKRNTLQMRIVKIKTK
jgi:HSP20 family protein